MPYNSLTSRGDVAALINEAVSNEIWEQAPQESAFLSLFRKTQLASDTTRIPVLSALPTAYWVDGDTGLKQTSEMAWANKYIDVSELAVIFPIPEAVLEATEFDLLGEIKPRAAEAFGRAVDLAGILGVNKPAIQPASLNAGARAAGNVVARGSVDVGGETTATGDGDLADLFNYAFSLVENDGSEVDAVLLDGRYKGRFRGARTQDGGFLYVPDAGSGNAGQVYGVPTTFPMRGLWGSDTGNTEVAEGFVGDSDSVVVGIRKDITWKLLDQAVITDNTGAIVYNLPQQDMVAMRAVFRLGWSVKNIATPENANDATRYPWAVITAPDVTP